MPFQESVDAPIVSGEWTFPKLSNRNLGLLAAKFQEKMVAKAKGQIALEKASPEGKAALLLRYVVEDYGIDHVHDWSRSMDGSIAVCQTSLVQAGMDKEAAGATVDKIHPSELKRIAMEATDHPNSPRRVAVARAEFEALSLEERRAEEERAKNPPNGGG